MAGQLGGTYQPVQGTARVGSGVLLVVLVAEHSPQRGVVAASRLLGRQIGPDGCTTRHAIACSARPYPRQTRRVTSRLQPAATRLNLRTDPQPWRFSRPLTQCV